MTSAGGGPSHSKSAVEVGESFVDDEQSVARRRLRRERPQRLRGTGGDRRGCWD